MPILLVIELMICVCTFLTAISTTLLTLFSSMLGILAVLVICNFSLNNAIILLAIAWLVSPVGLSLMGEKLLYLLYALCDHFKAMLCG